MHTLRAHSELSLHAERSEGNDFLPPKWFIWLETFWCSRSPRAPFLVCVCVWLTTKTVIPITANENNKQLENQLPSNAFSVHFVFHFSLARTQQPTSGKRKNRPLEIVCCRPRNAYSTEMRVRSFAIMHSLCFRQHKRNHHHLCILLAYLLHPRKKSPSEEREKKQHNNVNRKSKGGSAERTTATMAMHKTSVHTH